MDIDLSAVLEPEYLEVYGIKEVGHVDLDVNFKDTGSNEIVPAAHLSVTIPGADTSFSMAGAETYNENGIRIISKGIYADPSEYSDDLHILMIAENTSGKTLALYDVYDSLSINDYMATYSFSTTTIEDDSCAIIDILLWGYGLEDIKISDPSEIRTVSFSISIKDKNYKEIDEATITFDIEQ